MKRVSPKKDTFTLTAYKFSDEENYGSDDSSVSELKKNPEIKLYGVLAALKENNPPIEMSKNNTWLRAK